jgi:hypothetical protein
MIPDHVVYFVGALQSVFCQCRCCQSWSGRCSEVARSLAGHSKPRFIGKLQHSTIIDTHCVHFVNQVPAVGGTGTAWKGIFHLLRTFLSVIDELLRRRRLLSSTAISGSVPKTRGTLFHRGSVQLKNFADTTLLIALVATSQIPCDRNLPVST